MFSYILCATDLSPRSDEALRVAVHMAAKYNAFLAILNVHEEFMDKDEMVMLRVSVEQMQERFRLVATKCRQQMQDLVSSTGVEDLQVDYLIREGEPAEVIIDIARGIHSDMEEPNSPLIVMGTNGRDSLKERLLGSVAEHVVRHATCPVLVIPYLAE
ncbi:MAG: universal stress protein [Fidelibacterota bacterium]|nr:MAG: universal stress protein [Candidatus Neomarinimicrobiota bacterium]